MKIITIVGARPQFIKAAMLSKAFDKFPLVEEIMIHTGQHFDTNMSDVFFDELEIPAPKYNLAINGLAHGAMTGQMLIKIEAVLMDEKPDMVVVFGDTNSTLAGALAAKKLNIKLAHIEAGLRSNNMAMPEEMNRIIVDRISNLLFCPTEQAMQNLASEGFNKYESKQFNFGDVMYDAALHYGKIALQKSKIKQTLGLKNYVLATMHRAENINNTDNLTKLVEALNQINKTTPVVMPIHPRSHNAIIQAGLICEFTLIDPLGYIDMLALIQGANLLLTDSGGLQKEAYFFNKYCVTMRKETEWEELVINGFNILTGCDSSKIIEAFEYFNTKQERPSNKHLYGNGSAADLMAAEIVKG